MQEISLIEKFDQVKVSIEQQVPKEDYLYCVERLNHYKEIINQLEIDRDRLQQEHDANPSKIYYIDIDEGDVGSRYTKIRKHIYTCSDDNERKEMSKYTPLYGLLWVLKEINFLRSYFYSDIFSYFSNKYSLKNLKGNDIVSMVSKKYPEISVDYALEAIKKLLGGTLNFNDIARETLIIEFSSHIVDSGYRNRSCELKKNTLTLNNYFWGRPEYSDACIKSLFGALALFCLNETNPLAFYNLIDKRFIPYDTVKIPTDKVTEIKTFKNCKLMLRFSSNEVAKSFINMFKINDKVNEV